MELSPMRTVAREKQRARKTRRAWRLKLKISWQAIKKSISSTIKHHAFKLACASSMKQASRARLQQELPVAPIRQGKAKKNSCNTSKPLAFLLELPSYTAADFIDHGDLMTPAKSPMENISTRWRELHGLNNWEGLLDPLHPCLRREILKYGEFVEATYDAFDFDPLSDYCGSCRFNRHKLFEELGLTKHGYKVTNYIYAMSHVDVPRWFERSQLGCMWSKDSNWMGYVAVSCDRETQRIGRRDIVVAWRGTVAPTEWYLDLKTKLEHISRNNVKVQHGFLSIYKSKGEHTRYNKLSASEQVMQELKRLVSFFKEKGEEVSLTICGHSLGGALALLNAHEAATEFPGIFINVISFGAPRVGNIAFKQQLGELGVRTLRVVIEQDIVPKLPGLVFNKLFRKFNSLTRGLNWVYRHVGTQLNLDVFKSPYLKHESDLSGCHNLEIYLHLLDGFLGKKSKFRWNARRDVALVNKTSDMLIEELKIPEFWFQLPHKGLVLNKIGRWVKPCREHEDVPSPLAAKGGIHDFQFP